jgi:hypothetical protein
VRLFTRRGYDWSGRYHFANRVRPPIGRAADRLGKPKRSGVVRHGTRSIWGRNRRYETPQRRV